MIQISNISRMIRLPIAMTMLLWNPVVWGDQPYWAISYGGAFDDAGNGGFAMPDGGAVISGWTRSFSTTGDHAAWIVRVDQQGNLLDENRYTTDLFFTAPGSIRPTSDGGYFVTATTGRHGLNPFGFPMIMKFDSKGILDWYRAYSINNLLSCIGELTPDGGYVVVGDQGIPQIFILKLGQAGNVVWKNAYGYPAPSQGEVIKRTIIPTGDGGYAVLANIRPAANQKWNSVILKLDETGAIQWQKVYGHSSRTLEACCLLEAMDDQGWILAGSISRDERFTHRDPVLWKIDSSGQVVWQRLYESPTTAALAAVIPVQDGYVLLGRQGGSRSPDLTGKILVFQVDPSGDIRWKKTYGDEDNHNIPTALFPAEDGSLWIAGRAKLGDSGQFNMWILKLDEEGNISPECPLVAEAPLTPRDSSLLTIIDSRLDVFRGTPGIRPTLVMTRQTTATRTIQCSSAKSQALQR